MKTIIVLLFTVIAAACSGDVIDAAPDDAIPPPPTDARGGELDAGPQPGGGQDAGSPGQDAGAPDSGEPELYKSGTRIKTKMLTTPDGAKVFQGMYDNERQEDCSFQLAIDGATRCLPSSIAILRPDFHEDAQCTIPVALAPNCSPPPRYVAAGRSADCPFSQGAIFRAVPAATLFLKSGANCVAAGSIIGNTPYRASGPEIPPTSFQAATVSIE